MIRKAFAFWYTKSGSAASSSRLPGLAERSSDWGFRGHEGWSRHVSPASTQIVFFGFHNERK